MQINTIAMKKKLYLFSLLLLLVSVVNSPAFAKHKGGSGGSPVTTALPINGAIIYLAIAGLAIGLVVLYKFRLKAVKA